MCYTVVTRYSVHSRKGNIGYYKEVLRLSSCTPYFRADVQLNHKLYFIYDAVEVQHDPVDPFCINLALSAILPHKIYECDLHTCMVLYKPENINKINTFNG